MDATITENGQDYSLDSSAQVKDNAAFTIDATAHKSGDAIYTEDPNAYKDAKGNIYTLVPTAGVDKDGKIFTVDATAYEEEGKFYTRDPTAVIKDNQNVYVLANVNQADKKAAQADATTPVEGDAPKVVAGQEKASVVIKGQKFKTKDGKELIVFDPMDQAYPVTHVDPNTLEITTF